jgi:phage terminase large subunit-like protein
MAYSRDLAQNAIDWFPRYLKHTKGEWNNVRFDLLPWQAELVGKLFGTVKKNGKRQYKTVYCEVPKKNGKSELAAGIALKLLFADNEPGAEIYGAACDRDQASIVFHVAAEMVRKNPKLGSRCKILDSTKRIIHNNGSYYRVLSAESYSKHGYNVHGLIFDELHAQKNRELWDTLTEMSGDARTQPLYFAITTAGFDRHSICYEVHEHAQRVLSGAIKDPTFLPMIFAAEDGADWTDENTWKACNPSLGTIIDIEKVRESCKAAQDTPAKENNFKRLRLNIWTEAMTRWITSEKWARCNTGKIDAESLKGRKCYGGLDLSTILDVSAWTLCFPPEEDGGKYEFLHQFFIPADNMVERERRDKVPYSAWIRRGLVTATPGDVIDYAFIEAKILEDNEQYQIQEIGMDPWNAQPTIAVLQDAGINVTELRQGYRTLSPLCKDFEIRVLDGELEMGGNPVMDWMISCAEIMSDPAQNIKVVKPAREQTSRRIDGVVSSIMALGCAVGGQEKDSVYKSRGLISI